MPILELPFHNSIQINLRTLNYPPTNKRTSHKATNEPHSQERKTPIFSTLTQLNQEYMYITCILKRFINKCTKQSASNQRVGDKLIRSKTIPKTINMIKMFEISSKI